MRQICNVYNAYYKQFYTVSNFPHDHFYFSSAVLSYFFFLINNKTKDMGMQWKNSSSVILI